MGAITGEVMVSRARAEMLEPAHHSSAAGARVSVARALGPHALLVLLDDLRDELHVLIDAGRLDPAGLDPLRQPPISEARRAG